MNCPKCNHQAVKSGKLIRGGEEVQKFLCRSCGHQFWEGQEPRGDVPNPLCPKCQASTQKYGFGFKASQKVRKYRCGSCGHVFLNIFVEE